MNKIHRDLIKSKAKRSAMKIQNMDTIPYTEAIAFTVDVLAGLQAQIYDLCDENTYLRKSLLQAGIPVITE